MGRPAWTLLPSIPDWRWGLHGDRTAWYPSMRLFRRPTAGDWDAVVNRVVAELERWADAGARAAS